MNKTILKYLFAAAIAVFLGCYFRLYPVLFPISSESEQKAIAVIVTQIKTNIATKINQLYPGISEDQKNNLVNQKFQEWSHHNKDQFQRTIFDLAKKFYHQDRLQNPSQKGPETYLPDSDSYYFYGMTQQLIDGQKIMQQRKGAEYFNPLMLAPVGYWEKVNYHPYVGFFVYKVIHALSPKTSEMVAVSFTPIVLMIACIVLFVFCCRSLSIAPLPTAFGSIFFALAPIFLRRSFFGWYDNDVYNILFPLLITLLTLSGIEHYHNAFRRNLLAILTALSIGIYAYFWQGWVYFFCVLLAASTVIIAVTMFISRKNRDIQMPIVFFGLTFGITFLTIIAAFGMKQFFFLFQEGWSVLNEFFASSGLSLWPDIYLSVGELHSASMGEIVDLCGNLFWVLIAVAGIVLMIFDHIKSFSLKTFSKATVLFIFFLSSLILTLKAQRFAILFLVPISLYGTYGLQRILDGIRILLRTYSLPPRLKTTVPPILFATMALLFLAAPILKADNWAIRIRPIFDDQWDKALSTLKEKTPANSIINTWWSPGHFIKAIAQRRVTFDGATINVPQAYWMAQALYASDERYMLGILRMLNTSANKATEYLLTQGFQLSECVDLIRNAVTLSSEGARAALAPYLTREQNQQLLSLTHGTPAPSYLFLYNDLMETNIGIGFAARWNIKKIEEINKDRDTLRRVHQLDHQEFINLLWDLQGGMLRYGEISNEIGRQGTLVAFDNGLVVDLSTKTCHISSATFGTGIPKALVYASDQTVIKKALPGANLSYAVVLFSSGSDRYSCIFMDEVIASSMLVRLYFFNGKGLRYVTPFLDEHDLLGRTKIFAFQINWSRFQDDLESLKPNP